MYMYMVSSERSSALSEEGYRNGCSVEHRGVGMYECLVMGLLEHRGVGYIGGVGT